MSQLRQGTVQVTNGSAAIVGTGTNFQTGGGAGGQLFSVAGSGIGYALASVTDDTHATLATLYQGTSGSGLNYGIFKDFTVNLGLAKPGFKDVDPITPIARSLNLLDQLVANAYADLTNLGFTASVAGNALTISLTQMDGASNPSPDSPVIVGQRSVTLANGGYLNRKVTSAVSLVVPSGATLGAVNGAAFRLWVLLLDFAGVQELVVINCLDPATLSITPLQSNIRVTTVAIDATADSAGVFYSTTQRTNRAIRVLGFLDWSSGLTTAGTWDAAPSQIQPFGPDVQLPGTVIQTARSADAAFASGTTTLPYDDTIPQNTEGDQYMSLSITAKRQCNLLAIRHDGNYAVSAAGNLGVGLFVGATANALAAVGQRAQTVDAAYAVTLQHRLRVDTLTQTFKIRAGNSAAGTTGFNGTSAARRYGGVMASALVIDEIQA
jgi:hypothetical protein